MNLRLAREVQPLRVIWEEAPSILTPRRGGRAFVLAAPLGCATTEAAHYASARRDRRPSAWPSAPRTPASAPLFPGSNAEQTVDLQIVEAYAWKATSSPARLRFCPSATGFRRARARRTSSRRRDLEPQSLWPRGEIPYEIDNTVPPDQVRNGSRSKC
jgi:hypothetical protein